MLRRGSLATFYLLVRANILSTMLLVNNNFSECLILGSRVFKIAPYEFRQGQPMPRMRHDAAMPNLDCIAR